MTEQDLKNIFESPFNEDNLKKVMTFVFPEISFFLKPIDLPRDNEIRKRHARLIQQYGGGELSDGEKLVLFNIKLTESVRLDRNVKSVRKLISNEIIKGYQIGIGVFHNDDKTKWRFSLVIRELSALQTVVDKKPESYTYVFGDGEKGRTAAKRFFDLSKKPGKSLKDLEDAFSVEALSDDFFAKYKEVYKEFENDIVNNPSRLSLFKVHDREKAARDFVKRMMGRVIFLYFLQKRGWMGSKVKWENGDEKFMKHFFEAAEENELFYHNYLQPLFFHVLAEKREKIDEDCIINKRNFGKVPYLNGGLFEKDENHPEMLTLSHSIFKKFFEILESYNFTIIEDDPEYKEVAVDPEMLGHIFENLLEDNKEKGAFYTPKEIVQYMCRESLVKYITTHLSGKIQVDNAALENAVRQFVMLHHFAPVNDLDQRADEYIIRALKDVKVCDPAIGSGAFPMGILHEIFRLTEFFEDRDALYSIWGIDEWDAARFKESIIENSIYGVDIEKGAVDIARLRFWLSIIIDEKEPKPLPNLDYKIVVGDSLLSKFDGHIIEIDWNIKVDKTLKGEVGVAVANLAQRIKDGLMLIAKKQKDFFQTEVKNKDSLLAEIRQMKIELLLDQLKYNRGKYIDLHPLKGGFAPTAKEKKQNLERELNIKKYDELQHSLQDLLKHPTKPFNHFDWNLDFPEVLNPMVNQSGKGFDLVIGNPPYGIWISEEDKKAFKTDYSLANYKMNLYILFLERTLKLFKNSYISFIIPKSLLNNSFFSLIREYLLTNATIHEIYMIGEKVFDDAEVGGSLIFSFTVQFPNDGHNIKVIKSDDFEGDSLKISSNVITQSEFLKIPKFEISASSQSNFDLSMRFSGLERIADHYELKNGLNPGNIKAKLITKTNSSNLHRRIVWGKNINRYTINWGGDYVLYDRNIEVTNNDLQSKKGMKRQTSADFALRDESLFETSKILVRKTGDRIIAALDSQDRFYFDTLVHGIYQKETEYTLEFLLAILNSNIATGIYRTLHDVKGKVFAKISLINLKHFPLPITTFGQRIALQKLVYERLRGNYLEREQDNPVEREIDAFVSKLYNLTYSEVREINSEFALPEQEYNSLKLE